MKSFLLYLMFCVSLAIVMDLIPTWFVIVVGVLAIFYVCRYLFKTEEG